MTTNQDQSLLYSKDKLGEWWCLLNAHRMPKDFPFKSMSNEEAFRWTMGKIPYEEAIVYWRSNKWQEKAYE